MRSLLLLLLIVTSVYSYADGERTYKSICVNCHGTGLNNAPKVGDNQQWSKLIKEGQAHITSDGYRGVRSMPPKGGRPELSVSEFASAVVFMANQSGANWKEPDEAMLKEINKRISKK